MEKSHLEKGSVQHKWGEHSSWPLDSDNHFFSNIREVARNPNFVMCVQSVHSGLPHVSGPCFLETLVILLNKITQAQNKKYLCINKIFQKMHFLLSHYPKNTNPHIGVSIKLCLCALTTKLVPQMR